MNKKTILLLINGFGIEKKESFPIYDQSLMPTFDRLSKDYLFSNNSVLSNVNNYYDAYRNISLDVNELYNYSILDQDIINKTFSNRQMLINLKNDYQTKNGNLHIFCMVDPSIKIVDHLKETLKLLNPNMDKKIYLHLIISSNNIEDYKYLINVFSKINMDLSEYAEIGFIMGLASIDNNAKEVDLNFFLKMFISKVGEKWQSFKQKFDVLYGMKTIPRDTKPFLVNANFNLEKNDIFLFFNYDTLNLTNFTNTLANIQFGEEKANFSFYSIFSIISNLEIPYMYESTTASNSLVSNLENLQAKALILCSQEKAQIINYFCNGLKNEATETLTFVDTKEYEDNAEAMYQIINKYSKDLTIVNYDIDEITSISVLKNKLNTIDKLLNMLEENRNGSKYTLIVSSLYGMKKNMKTDEDKIVTVVFANELPFLYIDDFKTKKNYLIASGTINDIIKSCYKSLQPNSKYHSLVEKKNGLYKLFFK